MATVTHAGTTFNTTAGNTTVAATPAANDLIVVIAASTGVATSAVTDNQGGTYTKVDLTRTGFSTSGNLTGWIRDSLIASATSTIFTASQASSTGGGLSVFRVSGMTRTGALAARSTGGQSSGTSGTTPAPVLSNTPDTGNPVITGVASGTNSTTTMTPRTGYTEAFDNGYATPTTGLETNFRSSGETSATLTQGSTVSTAFASIAVELDTSAIPGPAISSFETSDWTGTGNPKTISIPGALAGDLILVQYGGDNGTGGSQVSAATVSTTGGTTSAWTEVDEALATSNQPWISAAWATVTADGDVTVSLSRTQAGTQRLWGGFALLARNHGGIGNHTRSAPGATETASVAVSQDSAVSMLCIDWDALTVVAFSPAGAQEVQRAQAGAGPDLTDYAAYWLAQAAGTRGYGIGTSSSTTLHLEAIEILAAAAGDATATPASVSAVASVPTATIQAGSTVTPASVTAVAAVPLATVRLGVLITTAAVSAVAAIPAPAVSAGGSALVTPAAVTAAAAVPAASVRTGSTFSAAAVTAAASIPASTIQAGSKVTPGSVAAAAAIPAPAVSAGGSAAVSPASVAAAAAVPAPALSTSSKITPAAVTAISAIPAPSLQTGSKVSPAAIAAMATVPAPAVQAGTRATPGTVTAVTVIPAPVVRLGALPAPAAVTAITGIPAPTLHTSILVPVFTVATVATIPAPAVITLAPFTPLTEPVSVVRANSAAAHLQPPYTTGAAAAGNTATAAARPNPAEA